jgi:hypothetical protein
LQVNVVETIRGAVPQDGKGVDETIKLRTRLEANVHAEHPRLSHEFHVCFGDWRGFTHNSGAECRSKHRVEKGISQPDSKAARENTCDLIRAPA